MGRPGPRQRAENRACGSANSVTGRALRAFVNRVVEDKRISGQDVKELRRDILGGGLICREEADMLLALDRIVTPADGSWAEFLIAAVSNSRSGPRARRATSTPTRRAGSSPRSRPGTARPRTPPASPSRW